MALRVVNGPFTEETGLVTVTDDDRYQINTESEAAEALGRFEKAVLDFEYGE